MALHMHRDLDKLKKDILLLGAMVEEATNRAVLALMDRRIDVAEEVQAGDEEIDRREIRIEEDCLKVLALHQPVANDLRFVIAVLKVNNDLERVGDLAGNLAGRAIFLADRQAVEVPDGIGELAEAAPKMLRESLDALIALDTEAARKVLKEDERVDQIHIDLYRLIEDRMQESPENIPELIQLLSVSRYLERIADLATNIAEDVVFLVDGDVVRHRAW